MSEFHKAAPRSGELLDVVDEQDVFTGQVLDKKTIHEQGLLHRDVHVWVMDGRGNMLQQQRKWDKTIMPGEWDIAVGEHVGAGESYVDAAVRGVHEELGLRVVKNQLARVGLAQTREHFPGWKVPHNVIGDNFVLVESHLSIDSLNIQEEEVEDVRWYPIDQLEEDLKQPSTAKRHASQPLHLYKLGIEGMRGAVRRR
jgi:isopentenyl-diphosphate delta-isomerase